MEDNIEKEIRYLNGEKLDNSIVILKYISKENFERMIENKTLFYSSLVRLIQEHDTRESYIKNIYFDNNPIEETIDRIVSDFINNPKHPLFKGNFAGLKLTKNRQANRNIAKQRVRDIINFCRNVTGTDSWICSTIESNLMWQLYAREGVIIKTTLGKYIDSILVNEWLDVGRVEYIDFKEDCKEMDYSDYLIYPNLIKSTVFKKSKEYQDERELRIYCNTLMTHYVEMVSGMFGGAYDYNIYDKVPIRFLNIPVNLNILIDEIVISPYFKNQREQKMELVDFLKKNNINILESKIKFSDLSSEF